MRWAVLAFWTIVVSGGNERRSHRYEVGEELSLWADVTGPWAAPHETYAFEELPYCELQGLTLERKALSLGEVLGGHKYTKSSRVKIFWPPEDGTHDSVVKEICRMRLTPEIIKVFGDLIESNYYYTYSLDGLTAYGFVGTMTSAGLQIYSHKTFVIGRNAERQVVSFDIVNSELVPMIEASQFLKFTYALKWVDGTSSVGDKVYIKPGLLYFPTRIQWFSIGLSIMIGLMLSVTTAYVIFRSLKTDVFDLPIDEAEDGLENSGWTLMSKEVFRKPKRNQLLAVRYVAELFCFRY